MAATAGTLVPVSYALAVSPYRFEISNVDVPVANLAPEFDGFRIAHLTDIHYGFDIDRERMRQIVATVNALDVDAVALTGDYADHGRANIDAVWPELMELRARHGVYAVLGNHDHWTDEALSFEWLDKSGFSVRHGARSVEKDGARLWFGGAGSMWSDHLGVDKAFDGVPRDEARVCLAHYPDTIDESFRERIDLMLAGHTHGGQIDIPGVPKFWMKNAVRNRDYTAGLYKAGESSLFVSRGIGCYFVPLRFNCPPEIAVLRLRPADRSAGTGLILPDAA